MLVITLLIPLALSAFTHLWNPAGFPAIDQDEGHYVRRAMNIILGLGPQESTSAFFYANDHPYFGQIFLASALSLVNYPHILLPPVNLHSLEMLYLVPRVLMGILAIVDTFLVYKIAETRYSRKVAFISATLFAVMPMTWFLRRIFLDSIQLPFILTSILFAVYYAKSEAHYTNASSSNKKILLILLSGIFLGLAIFTKVPVFTMIPLVAYIILKKDKDKDKDKDKNDTGHAMAKTRSSLKYLGIWFVPVILIPMIWPAFAISSGQINEWLGGVIWQATRADRPFAMEMNNVFSRMEPVLLALGGAGLIYAVIKRDYFILLWTFPYLILLFFINWFYFYHLIVVFPALCIAATVLLVDLLEKIHNKQLLRSLQFVIFGGVIIFGFINTTLLITQNLNKSNFELVSFISTLLPNKDNATINYSSDAVTLIGPNGAFSFSWIPIQILDKNSEFKWFEGNRDYINGSIKTEKFLMLVDRNMRNDFLTNSHIEHVKYISQLYDNSTLLKVLNYNGSFPDLNMYPYTNILDDVFKDNVNRRGIDWGDSIEIRANY